MQSRTGPKPILIVAGTRPEVIKLAPLYFQACDQFSDNRVQWVSTGQHKALEKETLASFGIAPSFSLDAANSGKSLTALYRQVVQRMAALQKRTDPALVVVQGDTSSAFAAAFSAFHDRIPVAHVEAGLRTYDNQAPYPEEAYRHMIDTLASIHFAPTARAAANLKSEGCADESVYITGNTAVDALSLVDRIARRIPEHELPPIARGKRLLFATMHRRESWGRALSEMCLALRDIAERFDDIQIIFPLHVNPRVQNQIAPILENHPRITLLRPLDFATCHFLIRRSHLILTDSGGIQEEAPSYGVPVLVLRNATERLEAIDAGLAILTGTNRGNIVKAASRLLTDPQMRDRMREHENPFGDGKAAERIVKAIKRFLDGRMPLLTAEEQFHPLRHYEASA